MPKAQHAGVAPDQVDRDRDNRKRQPSPKQIEPESTEGIRQNDYSNKHHHHNRDALNQALPRLQRFQHS